MEVGARVDEMVGNPADMGQVVVEEREVPPDALVRAPDISEAMDERPLRIEHHAEDVSEVGLLHFDRDSFAVRPRNCDFGRHLADDEAVGNSPPANEDTSEAAGWSEKDEQSMEAHDLRT